jgi:hypothetical protein
MANFFKRLKLLPWVQLFQVAALTTVILIVIEYLIYWFLVLLSSKFLALGSFLNRLFQSSIFVLSVGFVASLGYGALAVYILDRLFQRQILINAAILWSLVLCLVICLLLKLQLPLDYILVNSFSSLVLVGILLGVFQQGRRYWRW